MMGAVQPFISGAISKTINMPTSATIEDIEAAYIEAWKLGLKAVAVYRDGCKRSQPLSTGKDKLAELGVAPTAVRRKLPDERESITHKFSIGGHEGYITDRKSTRLNSSHRCISYAVFCLKKKNKQLRHRHTRRQPTKPECIRTVIRSRN